MNAGAMIWSAATCRRFGRERESGDESPHSKISVYDRGSELNPRYCPDHFNTSSIVVTAMG